MKKKIYIKIYHPTIADDYDYNFDLLSEHLANLGVTGIMTPVPTEQDKQRFLQSGYEQDYLKKFKSSLSNKNIELIPVVQCFQDAYYFEHEIQLRPVNSNGKVYPWTTDWYKPICPTEESFQQQRLELINYIIKELSPSALALDFCRFPLFWEEVGHIPDVTTIAEFCFCPRCLEKFKTESKIVLPDFAETAEIAGFIYENFRQEWINWKTNVITEFCRQVVETTSSFQRKPELIFQLVTIDEILPQPFTSQWLTGQSVESLSPYVDYFSPMLYHNILRQSPEWVTRSINILAEKTHRTLLPAIQLSDRVGGMFLKIPEVISLVEKLLTLPRLAGIALFQYGNLIDWLYLRVIPNELFYRLATVLTKTK
ncbi:MAG: putative glycoside hydrolase [Candidatus Sumerlaeia bacterium]|nr:putative glycoside hydrolase [Candidatus Sumerlaeia bacterium]